MKIAAAIGLTCAVVGFPVAALAASSGQAAPAIRSAHPAVGMCRSGGTRVWYGLPADSAAGTSFFQLQFSNIGRSACTLFGYPGVSLIDIHGHQQGLPATHSGPKLLVTIRPGQTAHVVLAAVDGGFICSHPVKTVLLRVFPPGQTVAQLVGFAWNACPGKSNLHVDAVHPGAGIPGFTIR